MKMIRINLQNKMKLSISHYLVSGFNILKSNSSKTSSLF